MRGSNGLNVRSQAELEGGTAAAALNLIETKRNGGSSVQVGASMGGTAGRPGPGIPPAQHGPRARPSCPMLHRESQLRNGLRRLCVPCHGVICPRLAFLPTVAMHRRLICFSDSAAAYSRTQVDQAASRLETFANSRTQVTQLELRASSSWPLATFE